MDILLGKGVIVGFAGLGAGFVYAGQEDGAFCLCFPCVYKLLLCLIVEGFYDSFYSDARLVSKHQHLG